MNDIAIDLFAHSFFSIAAGLLAWKLYGEKKWQSIFLAISCAFITGIFIDLDHLFDYFLAYGVHFDLYTFLYNRSSIITGKSYVIFHGFEYAAVLGFCVRWAKKRQSKMILSALLASLLFHLFVDMMIYEIPVKQYFIVYRILNGFRALH